MTQVFSKVIVWAFFRRYRLHLFTGNNIDEKNPHKGDVRDWNWFCTKPWVTFDDNAWCSVSETLQRGWIGCFRVWRNVWLVFYDWNKRQVDDWFGTRRTRRWKAFSAQRNSRRTFRRDERTRWMGMLRRLLLSIACDIKTHCRELPTTLSWTRWRHVDDVFCCLLQ